METAILSVTRSSLVRRVFIITCDLFDEASEVQEEFAAKLNQTKRIKYLDSERNKASVGIESAIPCVYQGVSAIEMFLHHRNGEHIADFTVHAMIVQTMQEVLGSEVQVTGFGITDDLRLNPFDQTDIARAS